MKPILLACALLAPTVHAQDDIESDRPDFVESSKVVGKGRVQLETGPLYERDRQAGVRESTLSIPTLLRLGLSENLEARIETDGRIVRHTREEGRRRTEAGYADTSLGLSWHVADEGAGRPSVGVLLSAELDSGSRAFRGEGVRPALRVVGEWELPNDLSLGIMPGIGVERAEGEGGEGSGRYRYGMLGVVLDRSFGERLRGFVEVAMPHIARARHGGTEASFDVGAAWRLSKDMELDAMFSRGLNSRTPDYAFTVGVSIRR